MCYMGYCIVITNYTGQHTKNLEQNISCIL